MARLIRYPLILSIILSIGCATNQGKTGSSLFGGKSNFPNLNRVVVFNGSNFSKKNEDGKEIGVTDEGWKSARYYFDKEKTPYTGDVILPNFGSTNDVAEAVFTFEKGRQEGGAIQKYPSGKPKAEGVIKDGSIVSAKGWHENGKNKFEAKIENGKLVSLRMWNESGKQDNPENLPKRIPAYIRGVSADAALTNAGLTRGALAPPDMGGLSLDNWLKLRANLDQKSRYQYIFNNVRNLYIKQRYNQRNAVLASYNLIRSPQYAYRYLLFIYYGQVAIDSAAAAPKPESPEPESPEPESPAQQERVFTGSGFFISRDGYFITNYHVIEDTRKVKVRRGQTTYKTKVVKIDKRLDLALLKVEIRGNFETIPIASSAGVSLGDKVYTIGYPMSGIQGIMPKYTEGTISSLAGIRDESSRYQVSVPVQPGNSGGALVNENGHITGVIVSGLSTKYFLENEGIAPQAVNYAIKSSFLIGFLEGSGVRFRQAHGLNSLNSGSSIKRTEASVGHVIAR